MATGSRWWIAPLVTAAVGVAIPAVALSYIEYLNKPITFPTDLASRSLLTGHFAVRRNDAYQSIVLTYDDPSGGNHNYCSGGESFDPGNRIPDCADPPHFQITITSEKGPVQFESQSNGCCQSVGNNAHNIGAIGRVLGRAALSSGQSYQFQVRVLTPRGDLARFNPRISVEPDSANGDVDAFHTLIAMAAGALLLLLALIWFVGETLHRRRLRADPA